MEWAQILVALVGGTILGRVWDNRREDRFRHAEQKLEVASEFLGTYRAVLFPSREPGAYTIGDRLLAFMVAGVLISSSPGWTGKVPEDHLTLRNLPLGQPSSVRDLTLSEAGSDITIVSLERTFVLMRVHLCAIW